jgi:hypothetical protein
MLFKLKILYSVKRRGDKCIMNWKGCKKRRLWPTYKVLSYHLPGGTEKTTEPSVKLAGLRAEIGTQASPLSFVSVLTDRLSNKATWLFCDLSYAELSE